jgi:hypothetical protein
MMPRTLRYCWLLTKPRKLPVVRAQLPTVVPQLGKRFSHRQFQLLTLLFLKQLAYPTPCC